MSKSGGVFQIDDVTRTMSKGGGCAWCSTHPSSDPPPPTWLAGYGPGPAGQPLGATTPTLRHGPSSRLGWGIASHVGEAGVS